MAATLVLQQHKTSINLEPLKILMVPGIFLSNFIHILVADYRELW